MTVALIRRDTLPSRLLKTFFEFYVDAECAVLIAQRYHRYLPIHVVLHLDYLLLC